MGSCAFCGGSLIWSCDFDFEDFGLEGDGIVGVYTCSECHAEWEGRVSNEE